MINLNITKTVDIAIGKGLTMNVDLERLFAIESTANYVVLPRLKDLLMDAHASCVEKDFETDAAYIAASLEKSTAKLQSMYDGNARSRSTVAGPSAFEKVMVREALKLLSKEKRKELAAMDDKGAAFIDAMIEKNRDKIEARAKAAIEAAELAAMEAEELGKTLDLDIEL